MTVQISPPMQCVVFFSGGIMSWAAGKKAVEYFGPNRTTLLFEAADNIGARLVKISDGRDPWQVFNDEKMIGNTRADPCSKLLKRKPSEQWLQKHADPMNTVLVFGIHWEEIHRLSSERDGVKRGVAARYAALGYPHVWAPMCDPPWMTNADIHRWLASEGLRRPRLYDLGFAHNNCGGFCIKAGEGHFAHLLRSLPEVYAHHEAQEEAFNAARPGRRRQTVLAPERTDAAGQRRRVPMSLREFREHIEASREFNQFDLGGCGCFLDEAAS